jgi:hypothetical protein
MINSPLGTQTGLLAGTACHESEQLSQKNRTNDPKISRLLAPLGGPAAAIANQRRCVVSGLICDTSAFLSPQLLAVAAAMAELPLMGNVRAGKSRLFQIRRSPDQRQRLLGRASVCVPITPKFSYR